MSSKKDQQKEKLSPSERPEKENKSQLLLALLLFLGAIFLTWAYLDTTGSHASTSTAKIVKSEKFENAVNKHLSLTNHRIELERQRMAVENAKILNDGISGTKPQVAYTNENHLDLSAENDAADIAKVLGRGPRNSEDLLSPDDVVQKELFNAEQAAQYSQAYKEEYARQFVENARRGGYRIKLSEDLMRVISVTPIRRPGQALDDVISGGRAAQ